MADILVRDIVYILLAVITLLSFIFLIVLIKKEKKLENNKVSMIKISNTLEADIMNALPKEESAEGKMELENLLAKMQKDLEKKEDPVTTFEDEQEAKSIISYQELIENKNSKIKENKTVDNLSFISIEKNVEVDNEEELEVKLNIRETQEEKRFKNSDFISPIFGRVNKEVNYPKIPSFNKIVKDEKLSVTSDNKTEKIDIARIEKEIQRSEKFLESLKEFRRNLE